jgi:hypothetical protein
LAISEIIHNPNISHTRHRSRESILVTVSIEPAAVAVWNNR